MRQVSIWAPRLESYNPLKKNYHRICIGHYAAAGFGQPDQKMPPKGMQGSIIEILEDKMIFMTSELEDGHLNALVPFPLQYRLVWSQTAGDSKLYCWKALPPGPEWVALGMLCTTTADEPSKGAMRCVPRAWTIPSKSKPNLVWEDSGTGGRRGSFWQMNDLGLLTVTEGHDTPTGEFYDLISRDFGAYGKVPDRVVLSAADRQRAEEKSRLEKEREEQEKKAEAAKLKKAAEQLAKARAASLEAKPENAAASGTGAALPHFPVGTKVEAEWTPSNPSRWAAGKPQLLPPVVHATDGMLRPACNGQHATDCTQQTTRNMQHATCRQPLHRNRWAQMQGPRRGVTLQERSSA